MTEPEYDEATCVTAGELRDAGIPVPSSVPDCGWIPRSAMRYDVGETKAEPEAGRFSIGMSVTFNAPFRWIALTIEQTPDGLGDTRLPRALSPRGERLSEVPQALLLRHARWRPAVLVSG